jgi:pimeloyl-ACP methyl ester carboxylesterase
MALQSVEWNRAELLLRGTLHLSGALDAPWVVFAHGFGSYRQGPHYLFVKLARALLQDGWQSLRFDFAGTGESDGRFCDMTLSSMVEDMVSALTMLHASYRPSRVVVVGHSMGGAVAALGGAQRGCDGVVLLAPVAHPFAVAQKQRTDMMQAGLNKDGFYEYGPHLMRGSFWDDLESAQPLQSVQGGLGAPLLLVHGDEDMVVPHSESAAYAQVARSAGVDCRFELLEGCDHNFASVGAVNSLETIVRSWLKEKVT